MVKLGLIETGYRFDRNKMICDNVESAKVSNTTPHLMRAIYLASQPMATPIRLLELYLIIEP